MDTQTSEARSSTDYEHIDNCSGLDNELILRCIVEDSGSPAVTALDLHCQISEFMSFVNMHVFLYTFNWGIKVVVPYRIMPILHKHPLFRFDKTFVSGTIGEIKYVPHCVDMFSNTIFISTSLDPNSFKTAPGRINISIKPAKKAEEPPATPTTQKEQVMPHAEKKINERVLPQVSVFELASGEDKMLTNDELEVVLHEVRYCDTVEERRRLEERLSEKNDKLSKEAIEDMTMLQLIGGQAMMGRLAMRLIATMNKMRPDLGHLLEDFDKEQIIRGMVILTNSKKRTINVVLPTHPTLSNAEIEVPSRFDDRVPPKTGDVVFVIRNEKNELELGDFFAW